MRKREVLEEIGKLDRLDYDGELSQVQTLERNSLRIHRIVDFDGA